MLEPAAARFFAALAASQRPFKCHKCLHISRLRLQISSRRLHTEIPSRQDPPIPLRKQLKEEAKVRKLSKTPGSQRNTEKSLQDSKWELTVGIEIHAELSTSRKLFSPALTSLADTPNTHVSLFDAAVPGTQPQFQCDTLLPALRAALAFGCNVQKHSSWDRKHYFHWDQPNGYQITQYHAPFALGGAITLYAHDDIDPADAPSVTIGLKQIQMEQDTAKTVLQPPETHLLDFNRASHPLIEIISLPHIHYPRTAAALVRKVQATLKAVGANTTGMELGGLRADVNVSVRRRDADPGSFEYAGVTGLGQRTEIKNLSSFKAVEDAIIAERDRQIRALEAGGAIEGETRGWTLGSSETRRLRGKEGEVDYRYMPDPDLGEVVVGDDLLSHLRITLPALPDGLLTHLTTDPSHALTLKDAKTLMMLDDGDRLDYYFDVVDHLLSSLRTSSSSPSGISPGKTAANFVIHDFGALLSASASPIFSPEIIPSSTLSAILSPLLSGIITPTTAKALVARAFASSASIALSPSTPSSSTSTKAWTPEDISRMLDEEGLRLVILGDEVYDSLARRVVSENADMATKVKKEIERDSQRGVDGVRKRGASRGKVMWFVGRMMKEEEGRRLQPERAEEAVWRALAAE